MLFSFLWTWTVAMGFDKGSRVSFEWPIIKRRRVRVERFLIEGVLSQRQIARRVGASVRTVAADTEAIYAMWRGERTSY